MESIIQVNAGELFLRHSEILSDRDNELRFEEFTEAGHWVMIDQSEIFYSFLL
jgi:hypothetical protein